jgi:hypothetical protein
MPKLPPPTTQTAPVQQQQPPAPSLSVSSLPPLTKTVYDSLAPLNLPSRPIIYVSEPGIHPADMACETPVTAAAAAVKSVDTDSRNDEKAKLDAILLGSMKPGGDTGGMPPSSYRSYGAGMMSSGSSWQPRMPMMQNGGNRPLAPNYRCNICKIPGHHRNQCPHAV